jgi:hypothetical protein
VPPRLLTLRSVKPAPWYEHFQLSAVSFSPPKHKRPGWTTQPGLYTYITKHNTVISYRVKKWCLLRNYFGFDQKKMDWDVLFRQVSQCLIKLAWFLLFLINLYINI